MPLPRRPGCTFLTIEALTSPEHVARLCPPAGAPHAPAAAGPSNTPCCFLSSFVQRMLRPGTLLAEGLPPLARAVFQAGSRLTIVQDGRLAICLHAGNSVCAGAVSPSMLPSVAVVRPACCTTSEAGAGSSGVSSGEGEGEGGSSTATTPRLCLSGPQVSAGTDVPLCRQEGRLLSVEVWQRQQGGTAGNGGRLELGLVGARPGVCELQVRGRAEGGSQPPSRVHRHRACPWAR